jgi:hypothetical protein
MGAVVSSGLISFTPVLSLLGSWVVLIIVSVLYPSSWVISSAKHMSFFGGDYMLQAAQSLVFGLVDTLSFFALDIDATAIAKLFHMPNNNVLTLIIGSTGALIAMLMSVSVEHILAKMFPNAVLEGSIWMHAIGFIIGAAAVILIYAFTGGMKKNSSSDDNNTSQEGFQQQRRRHQHQL